MENKEPLSAFNYPQYYKTNTKDSDATEILNKPDQTKFLGF